MNRPIVSTHKVRKRKKKKKLKSGRRTSEEKSGMKLGVERDVAKNNLSFVDNSGSRVYRGLISMPKIIDLVKYFLAFFIIFSFFPLGDEKATFQLSNEYIRVSVCYLIKRNLNFLIYGYKIEFQLPVFTMKAILKIKNKISGCEFIIGSIENFNIFKIKKFYWSNWSNILLKNCSNPLSIRIQKK